MFTRRIQHTDQKLYSGRKRIFPGVPYVSPFWSNAATEIRHQGRHSAGQILISEKNYRMHLHVFITLIGMHFNKTKFNTVLDT